MSKHHHKTASLEKPSSAKSPSAPKATVVAAPDDKSQKPKLACEEMTRLRAYQKWESAGKPSGNDVEFWLEAEQELLAAEEGRFSRIS